MVIVAVAGHAVTSWGFDKAAFNTFHVNSERISMSAITCILSGTLSACGGGLLNHFLQLSSPDSMKSFTWSSTTPRIFSPQDYHATSALNRSFILSCLYFVLLNQHGYIPYVEGVARPQAHAIIITLQVANYFIQSVFPNLDIFYILTWLLRSVLMIRPQIGSKPQKEEKGKED
jgi:hypothetical protein